jgi:hypothetical protein
MTRHLSGFNHITIFSPSYPSHNGLVLLQACSVKKYIEQELFASKRGLCLKYKHEPRGSWHDLCARKVSQYEWNLVSTRDRRLPMPRCCSHSLACCRFGHRQKKTYRHYSRTTTLSSINTSASLQTTVSHRLRKLHQRLPKSISRALKRSWRSKLDPKN